MAYRRVPFAPGEWYHLYTRGIDKRQVFLDEQDFKRFQALLYLANSAEPIDFKFLKNTSHDQIFTLERKNSAVAVGAYCLMKTHPHILVLEKEEGGITAFTRKFGTAYTMYFNKKYERIGNLMVRPIRSKHIDGDDYLCRVAQYIHVNSAEIFEPNWKKGKANIKVLEKQLLSYKFSSLPDYFGEERPERNILDAGSRDTLLDGLSSLSDILSDAAEYYKEIEDDFYSKKRLTR